MNIMKYIIDEKKTQDMTNEEFAAKLPFSRQRFEQIVKQPDCQFRLVRAMLKALGKDIDIRKPHGSAADIDTPKMLEEMDAANVFFVQQKAIIEGAGLAFYIVNAGASYGVQSDMDLRI